MIITLSNTPFFKKVMLQKNHHKENNPRCDSGGYLLGNLAATKYTKIKRQNR